MSWLIHPWHIRPWIEWTKGMMVGLETRIQTTFQPSFIRPKKMTTQGLFVNIHFIKMPFHQNAISSKCHFINIHFIDIQFINIQFTYFLHTHIAHTLFIHFKWLELVEPTGASDKIESWALPPNPPPPT